MASPGRARGRLQKKYVVVFVTLVSGALVASGVIDIYASYQESQASLGRLQQEKAQGAAARIEQFVREIERQVAWTAEPSPDGRGTTLEQRRADSVRLLRHVPALSVLRYLDAAGREQLRVARGSEPVLGGRADLSRDPAFLGAPPGRTYLGPVFRKGSEPHTTLAVRDREGGVTVAEVNLEFVADMVSRLRIGKAGQAYVVDARGQLVAHPDVEIAQRGDALAALPQVQAVLRRGEGAAPDPGRATVARDLRGQEVLTASVSAPTLGWLVFVDVPRGEAFAPLYAAILRVVVLLVVGLGLSMLVSLVLARRMVTPIQALQAGAARVGAGDLGHRIQIRTDDELETFAEHFNGMAEQLQELYASLEQKVEARTRELSEALAEVQALSEVSHAVSSSLDVRRVLDTVVGHAVSVSRSDGCAVFELDPGRGTLQVIASHNLRPPFLEAAQAARVDPRRTILSRAVESRAPVQVPDVEAVGDYPFRDLVLGEGFRAMLVVPMGGDGVTRGIVLYRRQAGLFDTRVVGLLTALASHSKVAIENAHLFQDVQQQRVQLEDLSRNLEQLYRLSTAIQEPLSLKEQLHRVLEGARDVVRIDRFYIWAVSPGGDALVNLAGAGFSEEELRQFEGARIPLVEAGAMYKAYREGVPLVFNEENPLPAYLRLKPEHLAVIGIRSRSFLVIPMIAGGRTVGLLTGDNKSSRRQLSRETVGLLQTFASHAAVAIQNARLFEEIEDKGRELEKASRHKSEFLAGMSHELRTPLNAIIGYSEMLQEEAEELGEQQFGADLKKINAAGKHLLELVNAVLDLSKIEAGKMDLYLEDIPVAGLVHDVVAVIQPLAEKKANRLEITCSADVGVIRADLTKLRQAIFNLLSNACKFTERGTVSLTAARQAGDLGDWITFAVRDTGIGLSAEQMSRLFQEFSQADASTTRKYGGTGLGLALSRRLCRLMGGDITVASEPGVGSTFTIELPTNVTETPAEPRPAAPRPAAAGAGTVLVIDDEPAVRDLMRRFLGKQGFRVETAATGEEGLRLARAARPDAITLDVLMPGMDGWTVLAALKADAEVADVPVIMLSIVDDKNQAYALGASDYLTKPIDRERLLAVLARYRRTPTVLVVDDDVGLRELIRRVLEKEGYAVTEAENGRVALERVREAVPGVILLDLMMPEMDGFEFVCALRREEAWRGIPVIVITAKDLTREDHERLNGYVEKVLQKGAISRESLLRDVPGMVAACVAARRGMA